MRIIIVAGRPLSPSFSRSPELVHQGAIRRPRPSFHSAAEVFIACGADKLIPGNQRGSRPLRPVYIAVFLPREVGMFSAAWKMLDVATVARHVAKHEGGHAIIHRPDHARGVTLLFREIAAAVGDDEAEIARAGIVDTGIIDLVENAVAQSEPHAACDRGRGADSALRARGPARENARTSGR